MCFSSSFSATFIGVQVVQARNRLLFVPTEVPGLHVGSCIDLGPNDARAQHCQQVLKLEPGATVRVSAARLLETWQLSTGARASAVLAPQQMLHALCTDADWSGGWQPGRCIDGGQCTGGKSTAFGCVKVKALLAWICHHEVSSGDTRDSGLRQMVNEHDQHVYRMLGDVAHPFSQSRSNFPHVGCVTHECLVHMQGVSSPSQAISGPAPRPATSKGPPQVR